MDRNVIETSKLHSQLAVVAMPEAGPRTESGKISAMIVQGTQPESLFESKKITLL
jgi:hypothetical protein